MKDFLCLLTELNLYYFSCLKVFKYLSICVLMRMIQQSGGKLERKDCRENCGPESEQTERNGLLHRGGMVSLGQQRKLIFGTRKEGNVECLDACRFKAFGRFLLTVSNFLLNQEAKSSFGREDRRGQDGDFRGKGKYEIDIQKRNRVNDGNPKDHLRFVMNFKRKQSA